MQPTRDIRISFLLCLFAFPAFGQFIDSPSLGAFNKSTASGNNLSTGLIAYYRFEEASGANNAIDATGNGWTLTQNGSPGSAAGKLNNCRTYNGSTQFFSHVDASQLRFSGDFTVTAWVNPSSLAANATVVSKISSTAGTLEFWLEFQAANSQMHATMQDTSGTSATVAASNFGNLPGSTWTWVCVRKKGTTLFISCNGGTENSVSTASLGTIGGNAPFEIGAQFNQWWTGSIDEVGYWSRSLSATEIAELYNSGSGRDPVSNP